MFIILYVIAFVLSFMQYVIGNHIKVCDYNVVVHSIKKINESYILFVVTEILNIHLYLY